MPLCPRLAEIDEQRHGAKNREFLRREEAYNRRRARRFVRV